MTSASDKTSKDTVYIDVDDEITAIIDKVVSSKHKIVALVLPRRSTVLQSLVNMKLLKRSSDARGKHLVLVTSEPGLLPLAGSVGLYVAKTPTSKPEIPAVGGMPSGDDESIEEGDEFDPSTAASQPIGALAGDEPIELDNRDTGSAAKKATAAASSAANKPKKGKNKKLKVPNFGSWRNRIILGAIVLALLITGGIFAFVVAPKATIAIQTDSESFSKNLDVTLSPTATEVDGEEVIVPARIETVEKTQTATQDASGQENRGERAEGSVSFTMCKGLSDPDPSAVPAGTGVSTGGKTYITQSSAGFMYNGTSGCGVKFTTSAVDIRAQSGGADSNTNGTKDFTVAGRPGVTGKGSADGGTDQIVKTLSQGDIDAAKKKLSEDKTQSEVAKQELTQRLRTSGDDNFVIEESFHGGDPVVSESAKAGDEVASVTITQKVTYSMASSSRGDLEELINKSVESDIDTEKQKVLESGLDEATFRLQNYVDGKAIMSMSTRVTAGPKLDEEAIKRDAAGKKAGDIEEVLSTYPGVEGVTVRYSPFWVTSVPKSTSKITVEYE